MGAPLDDLETRVLREHMGREVGWAEEDPDSVRRFLLQQTPAYRWHVKELEPRLKVWRLPGRAKRYRFPQELKAS